MKLSKTQRQVLEKLAEGERLILNRSSDACALTPIYFSKPISIVTFRILRKAGVLKQTKHRLDRWQIYTISAAGRRMLEKK